MYLIGLDEAGYGPSLGPLCHGVSLFYVREHAQVPDLWALLAPLVSRHPAPDETLCVDDSKKVYEGQGDVEALFQSVRHFHQCAYAHPELSDHPERLLAHLLLADDLEDLCADGWGIPVSHALISSELKAHALFPALAAANLECVAVRASACSARSFNRWLEKNSKANKADLSWSRAQGLLRHAWEALEKHAAQRSGVSAPESVSIFIDRQGGRKFYAAPLASALSGGLPEVLEESPQRSAYRLEYRGRSVQAEFLVKGESKAFPIALAALVAKLSREVLMHRFNAYFAAQISELKPTAGYPEDAKRFLKETAAFRKQKKISKDHLIRRK